MAEGVSGAPIVSRKGIVAMHVESVGEGGETRGVDIDAIRSRVVDGLRAQSSAPSAGSTRDSGCGGWTRALGALIA
ncbi:MAG: hypothetical protein ACT4PJ_09675 [Gemmatimonadaceae bacterium]